MGIMLSLQFRYNVRLTQHERQNMQSKRIVYSFN